MASMETIEKLKTDLRISHNKTDGELADLVDACLRDLSVTAGVLDPEETDPLVLAAIRLYVRAFENNDTKQAADYMTRYDAMKASLSMAGGYGGAV